MATRTAIAMMAVVTVGALVTRGTEAAGTQGRTIVNDWRELPSLPVATNGHQVALCEDALIVTGGRGRLGKSSDAVFRAVLSRKGEFKAWISEKKLPAPLAEHSAGMHGELAVVCGGIARQGKKEDATDRVWVSHTGKRGKLRGWRDGGRLPYAVYSHAQASYKKWIYVLGGMAAGAYLASVIRTEITNGRVGEWEEVMPLPVPLSRMAVLIVGKRILVLGGQSPGTGKTVSVPTVYAAPLWEDGSITTWYLASSKLPGAWLGFGRSDTSLVYHGGALFCFGGYDALWFPLTNMAWASFDEEKGEMGTWGVVDGPPGGPQLTRAVSWGERVYLIGGQMGGKVWGKVMSGSFAKEKMNKKDD